MQALSLVSFPPPQDLEQELHEPCYVCDPFAHAPLLELGGGNVRKPQKYTSSQHGNKCFKEEIRSVTKVGFVSKDKASFVRKDTTGT